MTASTMSDDEKARRRKAIDYARASVRLEGFVLDDEIERLNERYVAGEITSDEHSAAVRRHAGKN